MRGVVIDKTTDAVVVEAGGVGYEIFVTVEDWGRAKVGTEASYLIYEHLREDIHALYGFSQPEAKRMYELLLGVNGVGPKVALAILSAASVERLQRAITAGDPELLRGVAGVGKKTAERVMLELRGKLDGGAVSAAATHDPAYQALVALGYTPTQAAEAVAGLPDDVTGEQERIKQALKAVAK